MLGAYVREYFMTMGVPACQIGSGYSFARQC
jgi:hypothetical protein